MTDQTSEQPDEVKQTVPFAAVLQQLDNGYVAAELAEKLQQLVHAVEDTGKKGSLAVTLTLGPSKTEAPFEITPSVVLKKPAPTRRASVFYTDGDGNLLRRDPNQQEIPGLRDASAPTKPAIREAR